MVRRPSSICSKAPRCGESSRRKVREFFPPARDHPCANRRIRWLPRAPRRIRCVPRVPAAVFFSPTLATSPPIPPPQWAHSGDTSTLGFHRRMLLLVAGERRAMILWWTQAVPRGEAIRRPGRTSQPPSTLCPRCMALHPRRRRCAHPSRPGRVGPSLGWASPRCWPRVQPTDIPQCESARVPAHGHGIKAGRHGIPYSFPSW